MHDITAQGIMGRTQRKGETPDRISLFRSSDMPYLTSLYLWTMWNDPFKNCHSKVGLYCLHAMDFMTILAYIIL